MKLHVIFWCFVAMVLHPAIQAQSIQGSFEMASKRYAKGENFSGNVSLSEKLEGWKGERLLTQIVLWSSVNQNNLTFEAGNLTNGTHTIAASQIQLLFAKNVKVDPEPRSCGTYLYPRSETIEIADALSFTPPKTLDASDPLKIWLRINIPSNSVAGSYSGTLRIKKNNVTLLSFRLFVEVLNITLQPVSQWQFHLDLWQYPYQVLKHYNANHSDQTIEKGSDLHFQMTKPFYRLLADAGQKVVTAHIKSGSQGQPSMVRWIKKQDGTWDYDFIVFDRYVQMMDSLEISKQINCFSLAGQKRDYITYYDETTQTIKEIKVGVASKMYEERWNHFLTAFKTHLKAKGWFDKTVLYLDELEEKLLEKVIRFIHEHDAKWKIGLAFFHPLSSTTNQAVYDLSGNLGMKAYTGRANKISTFYTSCSQTIPNNYVTPNNNPAEMAWMAWHAANQNLDGYLRWAFDYWRENDPLIIQDGAHTSGDFSLIYRSSNEKDTKPLSSYRFEWLRKGIQDFEKTRTLKLKLKNKTHPFDREALTLLHAKIAQFHKDSGEGAEALVKQGSDLLNAIVKGNFTYCKIDGTPSTSSYTQWVAVQNSHTPLGNTWKESSPEIYSRYQGGKISVRPGDTFTLTVENTSDSNCARTSIWADWNGDQDFDDGGEQVWIGGQENSCSNPTTYTVSITTPLTAKKGLTRLRIQVRKANENLPKACGTVSNSTTRDFDIDILDTYCKVETKYNQAYFTKEINTENCSHNLNLSNTVVPEDGYIHLDSSSLNVNKGTTFLLNIKNSAGSKCARMGLWADWNQDGDFNDSGEKITSLGKANSCENTLIYSIPVTIPVTALSGKIRFRVQLRDAYLPPPDPCILEDKTGTTDFDITIGSTQSTCDPIMLTPKNKSRLTNSIQNFKWTSNGASFDQWRLKIKDAHERNNVITHFDKKFSHSVTSTTVEKLPIDGRKLKVILSWKKDNSWFVNTTYYNANDKYCFAGGTTHKSYYVHSLITSSASQNINYETTKYPEGGYSRHIANKAVVNNNTTFSAHIKLSAATNCARMKMWIDWNGDGDFNDQGETVYNKGLKESCKNPIKTTVQISVPSDTTTGTKRMRIGLRDAWNSEPTPCGVMNFNSISDFDVEVIDSSQSQTTLGPKLLAHYPLDDNCNDISENQRHANISGKVSFVLDDTRGKVALFTGTGHLDTGFDFNPKNYGGRMTISCWVKPSDWGSNDSGYNARILSSRDWALGRDEWDAKVSFSDYYKKMKASGGDLNDNQWHHLAVVINQKENENKLYIDGQLTAQATTASVLKDHFWNTTIGASKIFFGYNGMIDDIKIWKKTLNATQIRKIYNGNKNDTPTPPSEDNGIILEPFLSPNPNDGSFFIYFGTTKIFEVKVEVYNSAMQKLYSENPTKFNPGSWGAKVTTALPKGSYIAIVYFNDLKFTFNFIISK